jgi:hypothetical protein
LKEINNDTDLCFARNHGADRLRANPAAAPQRRVVSVPAGLRDSEMIGFFRTTKIIPSNA